jgi:hypothetical protein
MILGKGSSCEDEDERRKVTPLEYNWKTIQGGSKIVK